ncbi:MAG TPA: hypothetical protein DD624_08875 [Alphaproteobacteria bacterium]|nr:hypothetical protein [Alphaproteobacteria bacterium]
MNRNELTEQIIGYVQTDTLLYFAPYPEKLKRLQEQKWGAVIARFNDKGANLKPTESLAVSTIDAATRHLLQIRLETFSDAELQWFRELAGAYRSVLLALAVCDGELTEDEAFDLSCLEELFQNELWQTDAEALKAREARHVAAKTARQHLKG